MLELNMINIKTLKVACMDLNKAHFLTFACRACITYQWSERLLIFLQILWHPVKEGVLAFGTEEGKVGIYNVMSQTWVSFAKKLVESRFFPPSCKWCKTIRERVRPYARTRGELTVPYRKSLRFSQKHFSVLVGLRSLTKRIFLVGDSEQ